MGGRNVLRTLVLALAFAASCVACGSSGASASPPADVQRDADLYAIDQIEVDWHEASSQKNLDLMMSLWADNATFTVGLQTYTGKDQIRNFFATTAAPFKPANMWVSETPAYKLKATVNGDTGTLYFECHYVDADPNSPTYKQVKSVVAADQQVARINGRWVITSSVAASPDLTP
jgi:ketosteroid isomerase-like protein